MAGKSRTKIVPNHLSGLPKGAKIVAVTGTPGVGKTTFARKLSLLLNATCLDLNKIAMKAGLEEGFDHQRQAAIINEKGLFRALRPYLAPDTVFMVDSHLSHLISPSKVSLVLVVRAPLPLLRRRLLRRGYAPAKVAENLEAEIFGVCLEESRERGHVVLEIRHDEVSSSRALKSLAAAVSGRLFSRKEA